MSFQIYVQTIQTTCIQHIRDRSTFLLTFYLNKHLRVTIKMHSLKFYEWEFVRRVYIRRDLMLIFS